MRNIIIISLISGVCLLNSYGCYPQENQSLKKEDFKSKASIFLIKRRSLATQKYSDYLDSINNNQERIWQVIDSTYPMPLFPPPPPPPLYVHDDNFYTILKIDPHSIVSFSLIKEELLKDTILFPALTSYMRIDRKDTTVVYFFPLKFETSQSVKLIYDDYNSEDQNSEFNYGYSIREINKNKRKKFAGYDCYFVCFQSNRYPETIIETYVTDEISLEYHPFLNFKKFLNEFYPLYLKKINDQSFPDDIFNEITFFKY